MPETDLDKKHAQLLNEARRHASKVSPLIIAMSLLQEGLNLNQSLTEHCRELYAALKEKKNDEHEKRHNLDTDDPPVRRRAQINSTD